MIANKPKEGYLIKLEVIGEQLTLDSFLSYEANIQELHVASCSSQ